jgi:Transposase-associated domain
MSRDRSWMYRRYLADKNVNPNFFIGVDRFVEEAFKHSPCVMRRDNRDLIRCPCQVCDNTKFLTGDEVRSHLIRKGFTLFYECWQYHGENIEDSNRVLVDEEEGEMNMMNEMLLDAAGPNFNWESPEEIPNATAKVFYEILEAADRPLWELKSKESLLSIMSQLLNLKSDFQMSRDCFNRMLSILKSALPEENILPPSFHASKKLLSGFGLKYQKIDACPNDCMLYYKDNLLKDKYDICGESRYKTDMRKKKGKPIARKILRYLLITPRLQRLYMSPATSEQMRWHKHGVREKSGVVVHPADGEAWKSFDRKRYHLITRCNKKKISSNYRCK